MTDISKSWVLCTDPSVNDIIRWDEPLWAAPNKPRGKPDKIGEQRIEAEVMSADEVFELRVIAVEKLSGPDEALKVKTGDMIRRKPSTIERGNCHAIQN